MSAIQSESEADSHPRRVSLFRGYHYPMPVYFDNWACGGFTLLSLDLTSRCNYDCDWCSNKTVINRPEPDSLSREERVRLIEEASDLGARTLVAVGVGEPTLDPDFYPLVKLAHQRGMITVLYSNITGLMDQDRIQFLFDHDVSIAIKLDSFNMQHFLARNHTNIAAYYRFLRNFMGILNTYRGSRTVEARDGICCNIHRVIGNMVINLENQVEIEHMVDLCADFEVPLFIRPIRPVDWAEAAPATWRQLGNSTGTRMPDPTLVEAASRHNTLFAPSATLQNHCAIYTFGLVLRNNGDVMVCPDNEKTRGQFGNVRVRPLHAIAADLKAHRIVKPGYCDMLPTLDHTNTVTKDLAHIAAGVARQAVAKTDATL